MRVVNVRTVTISGRSHIGEGPVAGRRQTVSICPGSCSTLTIYASSQHAGQQGLSPSLVNREGVEVCVGPETGDLYTEHPSPDLGA